MGGRNGAEAVDCRADVDHIKVMATSVPVLQERSDIHSKAGLTGS
jgi:hypothetical protein